MAQAVEKEEIIEALRTVYDPEIPINLVDLGLIYDVAVNEENNVYVQMTLTFPGMWNGASNSPTSRMGYSRRRRS